MLLGENNHHSKQTLELKDQKGEGPIINTLHCQVTRQWISDDNGKKN